MGLEWEQIIVAATDPVSLGRWWCEALQWVVVDNGPDTFEIQPELGRTPGLLFVPSSEEKSTQNRLHIDLRPDDQDQEVERLVRLGAFHKDLGQGDVSWVVMVDPEGNEFCVLASRS